MSLSVGENGHCVGSLCALQVTAHLQERGLAVGPLSCMSIVAEKMKWQVDFLAMSLRCCNKMGGGARVLNIRMPNVANRHNSQPNLNPLPTLSLFGIWHSRRSLHLAFNLRHSWLFPQTVAFTFSLRSGLWENSHYKNCKNCIILWTVI